MSMYYSVAVRHNDGKKNLLHVENPDGLSPEQIIALVKQEMPQARVILSAVVPTVIEQESA